MEIYGIDVSSYNPVESYEKVAADGKKAAILRLTVRNNSPDSSFEKNYQGFRGAGMKTGGYKFSYALTAEEARKEAEGVLNLLNGRPLEFPVFYDLEWEQQRKLSKSALNTIVYEFRRLIVNAGYLFGIYCNANWYKNVLDVAALPYDYWIAAYPAQDTGVIVERIRPSYGIGWQYSAKGKVPGIEGNVDLDVFYKDYGAEAPGDTFSATGTAVSTGDRVNVRETPNGKILRTVNKGDRFEVDGKETGGWYHVRVDGTVGYIYGKYVKPDSGSSKDSWVEALQKAVGAKVDGIPGPETLSKCPTLAEGQKGEVVKLLQERLGNTYQIGVTGGYDGIFGTGTRKAVMEFQKQKGLSVDGIVGKNTWKKLLGL